MFKEFPKWVYPAGVLETYEPGQEPVLIETAEEEAALMAPTTEKPRRGRPPKVAEVE